MGQTLQIHILIEMYFDPKLIIQQKYNLREIKSDNYKIIFS